MNKNLKLSWLKGAVLVLLLNSGFGVQAADQNQHASEKNDVSGKKNGGGLFEEFRHCDDVLYAHAWDKGKQVVAADGLVTFDSIGLHRGVYPPVTGGADFAVLCEGVYLIEYEVKGHALASGEPLVFELLLVKSNHEHRNRRPEVIPGSRYASDKQHGDVRVVKGFVIANIDADRNNAVVVRLHNVTDEGKSDVQLKDTHHIVNASLTVVKIAALPE